MRNRIIIALIVAALAAAACSGPGSPVGSGSPSPAPVSDTSSGSPLEGTWTTSAQSVPDIVNVIAARGFAPSQVRPWISSHLNPAPYNFSLRFLGGLFSQFQQTQQLSSGPYTVSGDSLTWTDGGCAVTLPFHVSGSTLSFGKIGHEGCPTADAHMAHALFFGESYEKAG